MLDYPLGIVKKLANLYFYVSSGLKIPKLPGIEVINTNTEIKNGMLAISTTPKITNVTWIM